MNFSKLLTKSAQRNPNKTAVVFKDLRLTYREFDTRVNRAANAMLACEMHPDTKVLLVTTNCNQGLELIFACARINLQLISMNWRLPAEQIFNAVSGEDIGLVVFCAKCSAICDAFRNQKTKSRPLFICIDADYGDKKYDDWISAYQDKPVLIEGEENDTVLRIYTSGTTGAPKGVELTHKSIISYFTIYLAEVQWTEDTVYQYNAPFFHVSVLSACASFVARGKLVLIDHFNLDNYLRHIEKEKSTRISITPNVLQWIIDYQDLHRYDFSSVETILYAAAPMPPELIKRVLEKFSCKFWQAYGLTEMGMCTMLHDEDHRLPNQNSPDNRLYSVGKPVLGVEVKIVNKEGLQCLPGDVGTIMVQSPALMKKYTGYEMSPQEIYKDGWFCTGDLGKFDDDGYLFLVGREKDIIISGGENIHPKEIENCILRLMPKVYDVSVVGMPDEHWGESPWAFVVKRTEDAISAEEILTFCKKNLSGYKVPRKICFVTELPKNANGKVMKNILREKYKTPTI